MSQSEMPTSPADQPPVDDSVPEPFIVRLPDDPGSQHDWYLWAGVLALLVMVAFWPAVSGSFIWDDDHYVTRNPALLDLGGLLHCWIPPIQTVQYYPMTYTVLWVQHHIWGNAPLGYHLVNLFLHLGSAVILWRLLRRLSVPGAWVAAAIWAVHPLQAESVCWISEIKNILSGFLAFGSVLFYLEFAGLREPDSKQRVWNLPEDWQAYAISVALFVLAVFSKTVVCCVPVVLLLVLWWKRRLTRQTVLGTLPMFVLGLIMGSVTSWFETNPQGLVRATGPEWQLSIAQKFLLAARAFWFYIAKLIVPIHQSFSYPRVVPDPASAIPWILLIGAVALVALLFAFREKIGRGSFVAVACYAAALFPAMGFARAYPFRFSFTWDHFQYLASVPLVVLAVAAIARLFPAKPQSAAAAQTDASHDGALTWTTGLSALVVALFAATAWTRAQVFVSSSSLWEDALKPSKNPDSWLAASNLSRDYRADSNEILDQAAKLAASGDADAAKSMADTASKSLDEAERLVHQVIDNPAAPDSIRHQAFTDLGEIDIKRLRFPDANVSDLMTDAETNLNLAIGYEKQHDATNPDAQPYYDMGLVRLNQADAVEKEIFAASTRASETNHSKASATAGLLSPTTRPATPQEQQLIDRYEQARDYFKQAMDIANSEAASPISMLEARKLFEDAALQRGNTDGQLMILADDRSDQTEAQKYNLAAAGDFSAAISADPQSVDAHFKEAIALQRLGRPDEAMSHLKVIVYSLNPYYAPAFDRIGMILAESKPLTEDELETAIQCFKDALNLDPNLKNVQNHLDRAQAMLKRGLAATRAAAATRASAAAAQAATQPETTSRPAPLP